MKTVLLLRHAKSSWDDPGLPDSLRPLARRGRKAAPRVGAFMARAGLIPHRVLCSTARRATQTWDLVSEQWSRPVPAEIREDLYHASPGSLLKLLQELPETAETALLVGHNPTFEDLALSLVETGDEEALDELERKYPTGALCVIDFPVQAWPDIAPATGHLRQFVRPRTLKD